MFLFQTIEKRAAVTGIFRHKEDAIAFWNRMSEGNRDRNEGLEHELTHYPFYILEFELSAEDQDSCVNGLHFCTEDEVAEEIAALKREKLPKGSSYFTVYIVRGDWEGDPTNPGSDYMGALEHWHIDNDYLDQYGQEARPWKATAVR